MERTYLPVLLLLGFVAVNAVLILGLSHYLTRHRPTPVKQEPYESGMPVLGDARERFSVKFYMVAISLIVFDLGTIFLVPWAVEMRSLAWAGFMPMLLFVTVLTLGLVYEWKKGGLEWD